MAILASTASVVAVLSAVSVRALHVARLRTMAAVLAEQKMEELRGTPWPADAPPPSASPASALDGDVPGYVDYLDADGHVMGGAPASGRAVYVRRWSVRPLARRPFDAVVLRVRVLAPGDDLNVAAGGGRPVTGAELTALATRGFE